MIKNLIIIAVILGFFASVVFLDVPMVQGILSFRQEIKTKQQQLIEKEDLIRTVEALMEKYKDNEEILKNLDVILPEESNIPDLLVQLEALANAGGMVISDTKISTLEAKKTSKAETATTGEAAQEKTADYKTVTIGLVMSGDYSSMKNFLQVVEKNMRLIDVDSIIFSGQSEGGTKSLFDFDIVLKTYYYAN